MSDKEKNPAEMSDKEKNPAEMSDKEKNPAEMIAAMATRHREAGQLMTRIQNCAFPNPNDVRKLVWMQHEINRDLIEIVKELYLGK